MIYKVLKRAIERKNYVSVDDMKEKISILLINNQLSEAEYQQLIDLLNEEESE